jgi:hypothetical protein
MRDHQGEFRDDSSWADSQALSQLEDNKISRSNSLLAVVFGKEFCEIQANPIYSSSEIYWIKVCRKWQMGL